MGIEKMARTISIGISAASKGLKTRGVPFHV